MKICLFGGSFDPVHAGHVQMARAALDECALDAVVFLPAAQSPFKMGSQRMFSDAQRVQLLHAELAPHANWARVSDLDLKMPAPSWTWRLVEAWRKQDAESELFWLLGADQWELLHRWARYDDLIEQLSFIVYQRGDAPLQMREGVRSHFLKGDLHPASSSVIRQRLLEGKPLEEGWLSPQSLALIDTMLQSRGF